MKKAIFLDRDGTIITDVGYLSKKEDIQFLSGAIEALKKLQEEYLLVIITNQSGVARGYFTEDVVKEVNAYLTVLAGLEGVKLSGIYYCPHHPEKGIEPYVQKCECRKPGILLLENAQKDLDIDFSQSWMIGDKKSDVLAGQKAGCRSILVLTGEGEKNRSLCEPEFIASDLVEAADFILK